MPRPQLFAALLMVASMSTAWGQAPQERKPLPAAEMRAFAATYGVLLDAYVAPLEGADLVKAAIQGMLREIDPDGGEYWTEEEFQEFRKGPAAGTGSVGMEVRRRNGQLIASPIPGGPAQTSGLRFGDQLRTVDGHPVADLTPSRVIRLLQGKVGSDVQVGVYRAKDDKPVSVTIRRGVVNMPAPSLAELPGNLRLLRVPSLTPIQLQAAFKLLNDNWARAPFSGLVLDLRGNQGGPLESAIGLAAAFLPKNAVVATIVSRGSNQMVYRANPADYARDVATDPVRLLPEALRNTPLVALVDEQTASGAEIAVAAWRDAGRVRIVGRPTFGRGSIQTVTPIPGSGAIKYTSAYWTSPSGRALDGVPIQPDKLVEGFDGSRDEAEAAALLRQMR